MRHVLFKVIKGSPSWKQELASKQIYISQLDYHGSRFKFFAELWNKSFNAEPAKILELQLAFVL